MAMHMVKQRQKKQRAVAAALPYKRTPESKSVAEDTALAERVYGREGIRGGRYNMIVVAATRAYDLTRGAEPMMEFKDPHAPTTMAMLEIQNGLVTQNYVPKFTKPKTAPKN